MHNQSISEQPKASPSIKTELLKIVGSRTFLQTTTLTLSSQTLNYSCYLGEGKARMKFSLKLSRISLLLLGYRCERRYMLCRGAV